MRKVIYISYKAICVITFAFFNKLFYWGLLLKLFLLNIPHGKIETGGGIIKIRVGHHGRIEIGDYVNFANRWEVGYPVKCFLRVNGLLKIGNHTGMNSTMIFCDDKIEIGNNVLIGGGDYYF